MTVPPNLVGSFVVEVGERQAWPFVGFCDNRPTPPDETRLYIDTDYSITGGQTLAGLMGLPVEGVEVGPDSMLRISFAQAVALAVSGLATSETTHDVWWFGRP